MTDQLYVNEARYNLYATIHKGLRRAQTQILARIGSLDATDEEEFTQLIRDLRMMVDFGRRHLKHENIYIHGVLEGLRAGAAEGLADDHEEHERDFTEIEAMLALIETTAAAERWPLVRRLYLRYSRFLADDFEHMIEEETETLALLHQLLGDGELAAIEGRIIASVEPDIMLEFIRIMMPAMNPLERIGMLGGMKAAMPVEVFAAVVDASVKPVLRAKDWQRIEAAVSIAG